MGGHRPAGRRGIRLSFRVRFAPGAGICLAAAGGVGAGIIATLWAIHGIRGFVAGAWLVLTSGLLALILWDAARSKPGMQ